MKRNIFCVLILVVLAVSFAFKYEFESFGWWASSVIFTVLSIYLCIRDSEIVQAEGRRINSFWFLLVPVYLLLRDVYRKKAPVWFVAYLVVMGGGYLLTYHNNQEEFYAEKSCEVVDSILTDKQAMDEAGKCIKVVFDKKAADGVYQGKAYTQNGYTYNTITTVTDTEIAVRIKGSE
ncbi:TPA: hypothetical protein N3288_000232 [Klebsiella aerogenes]|nr:hypothetical protein [Klebsiella aerogenes]